MSGTTTTTGDQAGRAHLARLLIGMAVAGVLLVPVTLGTGLFLLLDTGQDQNTGCTAAAAAPGDPRVAAVDGYRGEQLHNATQIIAAARQLHLPDRAAVIGVATAMAESGLRVLNHGDAAGPDSRGLFQQRAGWGSLAQRMDPKQSALLFFRAMVTQVPDWQDEPLTVVAHTMQRNRDPNAYAKFETLATHVVAAVAGGVDESCTTDTATVGDCPHYPPGNQPWGGNRNGRIPTSALQPLAWAPGKYLRCDAAAALTQLDAAFTHAFGHHLVVTDAYRAYPEQVRLKQAKPGLAAAPGRSNHGWGLAIDLGSGVQSGPGTPAYDWMTANASRYGWVHPDWAMHSSQYEPWHWEYGHLS